MKTLTKAGGILIVFLALAALIGSSLTFAQDDTETPDAPDSGETEDVPDSPDVTVPEGSGFRFEERDGRGGPRSAPFGRGGMIGGDRGELFTEALAAELGITVAELEAAQESAQLSVLEQLVADGSISQEQMDEILANKELRQLAQEIFGPEDAQAVIAATLGMSVTELEAAREDGQRLPDLAAAADVTVADLMEAVSAARAEAIEAAVVAGTLTAEQAEQLQERPERMGPRGHGQGGPGHGGPRMPRGSFTPGAPAGPNA